jgi:hypothetical protein
MTFESITEAIKGRKFQPSKPIREIRPIDLQRNPEIIGSRKYNGNFSTAIANRGGVDFYTASNLPLANLGGKRWAGVPYWHHALQTLPCETVLLGEIHIPNSTIEDLEAFQEWYTWHINGLEGTENKPPQNATYKVFDVLCWDGKPLAHLPYRERFARIPDRLRVEQATYTRLQQAAEAVENAREAQIEGYVLLQAFRREQSPRRRLEGKAHLQAEVFRPGVCQSEPGQVTCAIGQSGTTIQLWQRTHTGTARRDGSLAPGGQTSKRHGRPLWD